MLSNKNRFKHLNRDVLILRMAWSSLLLVSEGISGLLWECTDNQHTHSSCLDECVSAAQPSYRCRSVNLWFVGVQGFALESHASDSCVLICLSRLYAKDPVQLMAWFNVNTIPPQPHCCYRRQLFIGPTWPPVTPPPLWAFENPANYISPRIEFG